MRIDRYDLHLDIDPSGRSFRGRVELRLGADRPELRLHAVDLAIGSVTLDGSAVPFHVDAAAQELRVEGVAPGAHRLLCEFAGRALPDGLTGMYVSPFGPGAEILTTQMYPTGARRFFPCRDEPAEKAEFHVTVRVPRAARVVFNTDPASESEKDGHRTIRFLPTPRMSTYLLYLGVGPFEETERRSDGLRTIVAHPAGRTSDAAFALEHAEGFVRAYEAYYAIPYPLPKLHLVAVPSFWAGAMENWGAIAFRETLLLVDARTDTYTRRWSRNVLAHEIAHQWFGNLVTNRWWNDFWLNESFANFVATRIIDRVHPGEATWEDFTQVETGRGFAQDALDSTHPVEVPIERPEQIGEIADGITYGKGASLLRMIESYLGEPAFRRGVTAYLKAHAYGSATGAELWASLDRTSDVPVSRIMPVWVSRPGHPVVDVRREGATLALTQRRFRYGDRGDDAPWPIPVEIDVGGRPERRLHEGGTLRLPVDPGASIRVNPNRPGFYHVRYDPVLAGEIVGRWGALTDLDQWGLLLDRFFFLASGDGTLTEYLAVVDRATHGDRYLAALTAARQLRSLTPFLGRSAALRTAHRDFFETQFARVGPTHRPGEPSELGTLRSAIALGLLDASPEAAGRFAATYRDAEASLDADLLDAADFAFVRSGGREAWRHERARIASAPSDQVAQRLACALVQTPDPASLSEALDLLAGTELAGSRVYDVLRLARYNLAGAGKLWEWYEIHLPRLEERWKGTPLLSLMLGEGLCWTGLERGERVRAYFGSHRFPEADRGIREGLERLGVWERLAERLTAPG